jgi:hypothetical protein
MDLNSLIDRMPVIQGCYLLTAGGELGAYGEDRSFVLDAGLSQALAAPIRRFREHFAQTQDSASYRIGLIYTDHQARPWHSATLAFEDDVLRRLYPVSSSHHRDSLLTGFQQRNREKSVFRGLELLLGYRQASAAEVPYYCPVLIYRNTTLDHYLPWIGRERCEADRTVPVIEVIDLLAGTPMAQRDSAAIERLLATLHRHVVSPEKRSASGLALLDGRETHTSAADQPEDQSEDQRVDAYGHEPEVEALNELQGFARNGFRDWNYANWFEQFAPPESRRQLGPWLRQGYTHCPPNDLRSFECFSLYNDAALELLAEKNPVFRVSTGAQLLERGTSDKWNLYLISGEVELRDEAGKGVVIAGGSPSASHPVARLKPRLFSVSARSNVEFLWLYEPMVTAVERLFHKDGLLPSGKRGLV